MIIIAGDLEKCKHHTNTILTALSMKYTSNNKWTWSSPPAAKNHGQKTLGYLPYWKILHSSVPCMTFCCELFTCQLDLHLHYPPLGRHSTCIMNFRVKKYSKLIFIFASVKIHPLLGSHSTGEIQPCIMMTFLAQLTELDLHCEILQESESATGQTFNPPHIGR
jgi:hypothetical protein